MKHNIVFLKHIIDEANFLLDRSANVEYESFIKDEILKRAFTRSLEIIGEAAKNVSEDFKEGHQEIEWRDFAGLRDKLIHKYFGVRWDVVWNVIKNKIPKLKELIEKILKETHEA